MKHITENKMKKIELEEFDLELVSSILGRQIINLKEKIDKNEDKEDSEIALFYLERIVKKISNCLYETI